MFISFNDEQPENISAIYNALYVLKLEKFNSIKEEQL